VGGTSDSCFLYVEGSSLLSSMFALPDLDKPFVVHVDASGYALGAVLQQDQGHGLQPVAFESRKLQPPERKLAPYDRELLALIHALLKWKHLLIGAKFTVHTDQQALKYLLTAPVRTSRQERWLAEIMRFMPDIKYRTDRKYRTRS
jgi:hypothetical protein